MPLHTDSADDIASSGERRRDACEDIVQIMYQKKSYLMLTCIIALIISASMFIVLYIKNKPILLYFLWGSLPIIPCSIFHHYRYRPFAQLKNGILLMDRGVYRRRLKITKNDIIEIKKYILNNELRGIEFQLKSDKEVLYLAPLDFQENAFLEPAFSEIRKQLGLKN